jgi:hypothetical protein
MVRAVLLVGLLAALGGCDAPTPAADATLLVEALAGPTCPVETDPPDPDCAPRPVAAAPIVVRSVDGGQIVAEGETGADGRLSLAIPAGDYVVEAGPVEGLMAAPAPVPASVLAGEASEVQLAYDTGIR